MNEEQLEQDALGWLTELGYTCASGPDLAPDGRQPERSDYRQVLLTGRLRAAIARLNPELPAAACAEALRQISEPGLAALLGANRHCHRLLVTGARVEYRKDGEPRGACARFIDWHDPAANDWLAVRQFTVRGAHHTRRPDLVLFVNGLPLVLIELKNPADPAADLWKAWAQLQTYQEQIPDLCQYNEILVISDGAEARMGALAAERERFLRWRTIDGVQLDPLGQYHELETLIRGALAPATLLEYLRHFVLFEDDARLVKKIAGYHQYHAVRAALEQVIRAARPGGSHKGGVVWHTQGSGKSITMTCFAACAMQSPALANPTLLVITDRNDLDGQLFGVFALAGELLRVTPVQATSRTHLRELLANRPSGGIVFATIQKFMPDEDEDAFPQLSDRHNLIVIADEAHRTQYGLRAQLRTRKRRPAVSKAASTPAPPPGGTQTSLPMVAEGVARYEVGYAQHLRDALPNATFVAFTGTPVAAADRDTRAVFGDYIHIYDMQQAQEDGATVAIYFESRLARLGLREDETPQLDAAVDELAEDEEESQRARLKSRWAALERIVGAGPRIGRIAADLVRHFEERNRAQHGKAMIVAMSRDICVHLYDALIALRPDWHDPDPERGAIKIVMTGAASDQPLLRAHVYSGAVRRRLEQRFKDPDDALRIAIVRDMWLTGFDAPCVHTLYVDKPMRSHNLMQAIARVNRVFRDKPGGLVVDYIGIADELRRTLRDYTDSHGRGRPTVDAHEAWAVLATQLDILHELLRGHDWSGFRTAGYRGVGAAANHIAGLQDGKRRFADHALAMSKAFSLCCTLDEARAVRDEVAFLQAIRSVLTKPLLGERRRSDAEREHAIRQIIDSAVVSGEVVDIFQAVGLDKPDIGILDEAFLAEVRSLPEQNLAVELLERLLEGEIRARFAGHVVQERRFSELLAASIRRYQNRAIETAQVIEELIRMAHEFQRAAGRGAALGLDDAEVRFYEALTENESAVRELSDDTLKLIARELTASLRRSLSVDWSKRESVRAKLRILVRSILKKHRYPPDRRQAAVELVLEQAERLGEDWAA